MLTPIIAGRPDFFYGWNWLIPLISAANVYLSADGPGQKALQNTELIALTNSPWQSKRLGGLLVLGLVNKGDPKPGHGNWSWILNCTL